MWFSSVGFIEDEGTSVDEDGVMVDEDEIVEDDITIVEDKDAMVDNVATNRFRACSSSLENLTASSWAGVIIF